MSVLSKYKFWIGGMLGLLVIALIVGAVRPSHVAGANQGAPLDVQVVQVEQKDVPIYGEWIGTLDGLVNADVRAQVTGYLLRQGYQEGALVKKGQLLFSVQSPDISGAFNTYVKAQADEQLANKAYLRAQDLYQHGAISQAMLEQAEDTEKTPKPI